MTGAISQQIDAVRAIEMAFALPGHLVKGYEDQLRERMAAANIVEPKKADETAGDRNVRAILALMRDGRERTTGDFSREFGWNKQVSAYAAKKCVERGLLVTETVARTRVYRIPAQ